MTELSRRDDQLTAAVEVIQSTLGNAVAGLYLFGSAVTGGLRPASDLDLFLVTRRSTTIAERLRLVELLTPISDRRKRPSAWRPLEITVVVESDMRPSRYPLLMDFQHGEWLRAEFDAGTVDTGSRPNPDLTVLSAMVLAANHPLLGPPPAELLDPTSVGNLIRAMADGIPALVDDLTSDTANVLLTLARIWHTVEAGLLASKHEAADWALARVSIRHGGPLRRARDVYLGEGSDEWNSFQPEAKATADFMVAEINRAASSARSAQEQ